MQVKSNEKHSKEPFFSVIMPVYNAENVVENTLKCVNDQTFKDYEVIIVNDGSKDNTEGVVLKYISDKPNYYYYSQENGGPGSARGHACNMAKGRYFAFIDDDDFWYPKKLEILFGEINEEYQVYYHDEIQVIGKKRKMMTSRQLAEDSLSDLVINGNALFTSATVVEGDFFRKVDPYHDKKRVGEDYECWIRLAAAGADFKYVNKVLGEYRRTSNSLTMGNKDYVFGTLQFLEDKYDYLDKNKYSNCDIELFKKKRAAYNQYVIGRWKMREKDFRGARESFKNAREGGFRSIKCMLASALAGLRVSI